MVNQIAAFMAYIGPILVIMLKAGVVIGGAGSVIEAIGLTFHSPKMVNFGKFLEGVGTDIPKIVARVSSALGRGAAPVAALLIGIALGSALSACSNSPQPCSPTDTAMAAHALECAARVRAECAGVPDSECPAIKECDAWGEARCGAPSAGAGGAS